jgi:hypothetical protein
VFPRTFFLRPDGWYVRSEDTGDTTGYFITKQPIPEDAAPGSVHFDTGFTINIVRRVGRAGVTPAGLVRRSVDGVKASGQLDLDQIREQLGPRAGFHLAMRTRPADGRPSIRMREIVVGDEIADMFFMVAFEAPAASWDQEWPTAAVVFNDLADWLKRPNGAALIDHDTTGRSARDVGWREYRFVVRGTGSDRHSFVSVTPGSAGPGIDDVRLVLTAEPADGAAR